MHHFHVALCREVSLAGLLPPAVHLHRRSVLAAVGMLLQWGHQDMVRRKRGRKRERERQTERERERVREREISAPALLFQSQ